MDRCSYVTPVNRQRSIAHAIMVRTPATISAPLSSTVSEYEFLKFFVMAAKAATHDSYQQFNCAGTVIH